MLKYLWYVLRHKYFVFLESCKLGIIWLGLIHDLSRFLPDEFLAYTASQPYNKQNKPFDIDVAFTYAWNNHQHRNKHHWEYWVHFDYHTHELTTLPIPNKYIREMIADWYGAGRAKGTSDIKSWYLANRDKMLINADTRKEIELYLGIG